MNKPIFTADTWAILRQEAIRLSKDEPVLHNLLHTYILQHSALHSALSCLLADKLDSSTMSSALLQDIFIDILSDSNTGIMLSVGKDLLSTYERDAACDALLTPFLFFKGFHALQAYRIAHWLWQHDRRALALHVQSQMSLKFGVDIHPAAIIGAGIMLDHGTGFVVGETCVIEDNVSILQSVTLGGTGKEQGDRHPKIRHGVLIGAGAKILGNIEVGEGAKIGAGSVVLKPVKAHTTVAGVPAKEVGHNIDLEPALGMDHDITRCVHCK